MLQPIWGDLAVPFTLLLAWFLGELGQRWLSLPRIVSYAAVGILIAGITRVSESLFQIEDLWNLTLLAQIAFGLLLFEFGYRIDLTWLRKNPWMTLSGLTASCGCFAAVYFLAGLFGMKGVPALLLAALSSASSPLTVLPVLNEMRSSGQMTERILHLAAISCVFSIIAFNAVAGYWALENVGSVFQAVWTSLIVVGVSAGLGVMFGVVLPRLLNLADAEDRHTTVAFAIAIAALILVTHSLHFSPVLATLSFGLVARHFRNVRYQTQPSFGVLGEMLCIILFVHIGSRLQFTTLTEGALLACLLVLVRLFVHAGSLLAFAQPSGMSFRKAGLASIGLMPMASFALLLLELAAHRGLAFPATMATMCGLLLLLDLLASVLLRRSLIAADEAGRSVQSN